MAIGGGFAAHAYWTANATATTGSASNFQINSSAPGRSTHAGRPVAHCGPRGRQHRDRAAVQQVSRRSKPGPINAGIAVDAGTDELSSTGKHRGARAATPGCSLGFSAVAVAHGSAGTHGVTITQTSTTTGLAPGIALAGITGIVTNHGHASTYVTAITVSISAVTPPHQGRCSAADYVLLDTVMPVARTLGPGESGNFGGASIGFRNRAINQDSCKRAVVTLRYVSS